MVEQKQKGDILDEVEAVKLVFFLMFKRFISCSKYI